MKNLFFLIALMLFISCVSAGLIVNPSTISINKTRGTNYAITFNVSNLDGFTYYNISFPSNTILSSFNLNQLQSNQFATITTNVITNENINTVLKLKGFYYTNTGEQNKTYEVNITSYTLPISPCDFSVIKGDRVVFNNKLSNAIILKDINNNVDVATISPAQSYILSFPLPTSFRYSVYVAGFQLSNICTISALDSYGLVNNPNNDASVNFNINNQYENTQVDLNLINSNFSMNFYEEREGILSVTNIGNKTAYNVLLSSDWISFSPNNFNLAPSENKGIIFKINPIILTTNDTNRTYIKNIQASGNFATINKSVNIFINHAEFYSNSSSPDVDYLKNTFCPAYPNSVLCNGTGERVIYKYISNASDSTYTYNMTGKEMRDLWLFVLNWIEEQKTNDNYVKENIYDIKNSSVLNNDEIIKIRAELEKAKEEQNTSSNNVLIIIITLISIFILAVIGYLIHYYYNKNKNEELRRL